jgi:hypothetical protein
MEGGGGCVAGMGLEVCLDAVARGEYVSWNAPEFHWNQIQVPQIIIRVVFQKKKYIFCTSVFKTQSYTVKIQ